MGILGSKQLQLSQTPEVLQSTFSKGLLKVTKGYGFYLKEYTSNYIKRTWRQGTEIPYFSSLKI